MPRKHETPASKARNRDNQRRSRARRRELVDQLQERLSQYERRGVAATLEMQQAARVVALENQCLRELLELRGVSRDEIGTYLSHRMGNGRGASSDVDTIQNKGSVRPNPTQSVNSESPIAMATLETPTPPSSQPLRRPTTHAQFSYDTEGPARSEPGLRSSPPRGSTQRHHTVDKSPALEGDSCEVPSFTSPPCNTPPQPHDGSYDILRPVSDCFCPPQAAAVALDQSPGQSSTLEMSCENAARILAELQGYGDSAELRSKLGCKESSNCRVKNTKLFQLMDELG